MGQECLYLAKRLPRLIERFKIASMAVGPCYEILKITLLPGFQVPMRLQVCGHVGRYRIMTTVCPYKPPTLELFQDIIYFGQFGDSTYMFLRHGHISQA